MNFAYTFVAGFLAVGAVEVIKATGHAAYNHREEIRQTAQNYKHITETAANTIKNTAQNIYNHREEIKQAAAEVANDCITSAERFINMLKNA